MTEVLHRHRFRQKYKKVFSRRTRFYRKGSYEGRETKDEGRGTKYEVLSADALGFVAVFLQELNDLIADITLNENLTIFG